MMQTVVRHLICPLPMGCRWCGVQERGHAQRWVPSKGWHTYVHPTGAQRIARFKIRRRLANDWEYDPIWQYDPTGDHPFCRPRMRS
jgi:hypothetical protein